MVKLILGLMALSSISGYTGEIPAEKLSSYLESAQLALRSADNYWCDIGSSGTSSMTSSPKFITTFNNYTHGFVEDHGTQPILRFEMVLNNKRKLSLEVTSSADATTIDSFIAKEYSPIRINVGTLKKPQIVDQYKLEAEWSCHI